MYIIFDTETTGLPKNWNLPYTAVDNWPRCIQIAWQLHDENGKLVEANDFLIQPDGFDIPYDSERIHGISTLLAQEQGIPLEEMLHKFNEALGKAEFIVGQNLDFDVKIMGAEFVRMGLETPLHDKPILDTCTEITAELCQLPGGKGGKFKLPQLTELHQFLFGNAFDEAHNATADVEATARCFFELIRRRIFTAQELHRDERYFETFLEVNPQTIAPIGLKHKNLKKESEKLKAENQSEVEVSKTDIKEGLKQLEDTAFVHLHNHTRFSVLQATSNLSDLINKAAEYNMPAVAMTDIGNMMGAFNFEKLVSSYNKSIRKEKEEAERQGIPYSKKEIIPIIGCEFFVCEDHTNKNVKDNGYQIVLLAKNKNGYHNLSKMSSIAFTEGKYYVPRIDKKIIQQYKEDIIVLSGNLYGEISSKILNMGEKQAEEALLWWKEEFGDDFYLEVMRHGQEDEKRVEQTLLNFSKKHNVKLVATNNTYYINQEDAEVHDILLCIKDGELKETPIGRGRGFRYGLPNQNYYFRSSEEMKQLFADLPEAIETTIEIANKCEHYPLASDILLPAFDIPSEFKDDKDLEDGGKRGENNYLKHLTFVGAEKRYGEVTDSIKERLDYELSIIEKTGYPGYFLIVQDFCQAAREMGVIVGPGRGSAAGSAVAYCIGITNVDPIKYDLLFERFLNPDRVSMPDIDIDFDDEGRGKVIEWVINKYGANQVAQIITYGTMAAKSSVRDTARVLDLPLFDADRIAKLLPDISLDKLFKLPEDKLREKLKESQDEIEKAQKILSLSNGSDLEAKVINNARAIEGSLRNTGIHACGVIITPKDITDIVPVALAKDSDMYCTQYDNRVVEEAGLLKMDFLGLKTLTLIKDAVALVKETTGIELIPDDFPLDDEKTYELFQRGETVGIFQYESPGMQKHLKALRPTVFADLIAMNALYRPGPMEYIPQFIKRKLGEEEIEYDLDDMKEYLEETYGITVYQEQVMLLSQKLAGFTKGEADTLRKAMGKKKFDLLAQLKPKFLNQGAEKGHDKKILEKIWHDWEAFASYAFNKSHSTCYAWIAYQTAYLKAHYPAQYMASVLSNNMNDIKSVTFFMEECRRMGVKVLGPDVNESNYKFTVNKEGAIRFGLGGIKGVGSSPVAAIMEERAQNGSYTDIFDMTKRIDLRHCNKKAFEGLILAGALDSFTNMHRAQYFAEENNRSFLTLAMKFGNDQQDRENSNQVSLFGGESKVETPAPRVPITQEWSTIQKLNREKEVVGIYISGHPLDDYKLDIHSFCSGSITDIKELEHNKGRDLTIAAIITEFEHRHTRKGDPFGTITIEDYNDSHKLFFFHQDYGKFKDFMIDGAYIYIQGKIQPKRWGDELEFKAYKIGFLSELRKQKVSSLKVEIDIHSITEELIMEIESIFMENKGDIPVQFKVLDITNKMEVDLTSKTIRVDVNEEFVKKLDQLNLKCSLI